jgi:membrane protein implicated in regulation of membrane protease activity
MSAEQLRLKAERRRTKSRCEALISIAGGIFLSAVFGLACYQAGALYPRLGWAVLSLWSLYFAWQSYRWVLPRNEAPDATLEFYRSELEKRRDYARHIWRRAGLTFCFLGLALIVVPALFQLRHTPRLMFNAVPFLTLIVIWFVVFFRQKKQKQQRLQQDLDELQAFERK